MVAATRARWAWVGAIGSAVDRCQVVEVVGATTSNVDDVIDLITAAMSALPADAIVCNEDSDS